MIFECSHRNIAYYLVKKRHERNLIPKPLRPGINSWWARYVVERHSIDCRRAAECTTFRWFCFSLLLLSAPLSPSALLPCCVAHSSARLGHNVKMRPAARSESRGDRIVRSNSRTWPYFFFRIYSWARVKDSPERSLVFIKTNTWKWCWM